MDAIFQIESQDEFQKAIEDLVSNFHRTSTITQTPKNSTLTKSTKEEIKNLLKDSNFDTDKVPELLKHKGWHEEKIAYLVKLLSEKKTELLYATLTNHNSEYGETITNFDWLFKLVLGTSELNMLKYPLLQLVLSTESNGNQKKFLYDVNMDMLLKLIDTLEQIGKI